ncbi:hypothetical protein ABN028_19345 [Actinopolymorpha sp. B17G11]|uniref:zinc finger domain-containing protein n=1 Tax=Actinopolymorpha sp. B17G11 TaxID=3160861 RepID=UPI0032E3FABA
MTDTSDLKPAELFQLGRDVDRIIESSEHHARNYYDFQNGAEYAATLAALLHELIEQGDVSTMLLAVNKFGEVCHDIRETDEKRRARNEAAYAEAVRRHELAIKVDCPYCGSAAGTVCRTKGPNGSSGPKGVHDHADRYRAATSGQSQPN